MATIIRNLIITSFEQLYGLLKNKEELVKNYNQLSKFMEYVEDYLNGCKCMEDAMYHLTVREYNKISENNELTEVIKNYFSCNIVKIFKI
jgi:uncharacterized protein with von Willebrand factor type A (vWA) domain